MLMIMCRVTWVILLLALLLHTNMCTADDSELADEFVALRKIVLTRMKEEQDVEQPREKPSDGDENSDIDLDLRTLIVALQRRKLITEASDTEEIGVRSKTNTPRSRGDEAASIRTAYDSIAKRASCVAGKVKCPADGKCMPLSWLCDGYADCKDWDEDPSVCVKYPCQSGHEHCPGGHKCISTEWLCDGESDCPDGGDESPSICESHKCPDGKYQCRTSSTCLGPKRFCNGKMDCEDGSDEDVDVCKHVPCPSGRVRCPGGAKCIHPTWECDGEEDCQDGYDEARELCESKQCSDDRIKCASRKGSYICLYKDYMCDGIATCMHDWDEKQSNCAIVECGEGHVRCSDDSCLSLYAYCGGWAKCKGKPVTRPSCADFFIHETYKKLTKKVLSITDEAERERLLTKLIIDM